MGQTDIVSQIDSLAAEYGGTPGVFARDLKTGATISLRGEQKFPAASVIKLPIMVEFFFQVAAGKIDPGQEVLLTDSLKCGGSGLMQFYQGARKIRLIDAVQWMIIVSDNTATNLVIQSLGATHAEQLAAVNQRMTALGLKNTRLLNKMMAWTTKTDSIESIRYGVAVTTPADQALLLEKMYRGELVSPEFSAQMVEILKHQQYDTMMPRFLPRSAAGIHVAHKTGGVTGVRNDVGLVYSARGDLVMALFCEENPDLRGTPDNAGDVMVAKMARLVWNQFTGDRGFDDQVSRQFIDWNPFPGGRWAKIELANAPFPHPARREGYRNSAGEFFPYPRHYADNHVLILIPDGWQATPQGINLVVHFHGHYNRILNVLEQFRFPQQFLAAHKNAMLVLVQGPREAPDSFGGKLEDPDGFKNMIQELLARLQQNGVCATSQIQQIIISAHSGGYRPAAFVLEQGGLTDKISEVYLFDAFYGQHDKFLNWISLTKGRLISIYTEHLAANHQEFFSQLKKKRIKFGTELSARHRLIFYPSTVCHDCVLTENFYNYLKISGLPELE